MEADELIELPEKTHRPLERRIGVTMALFAALLAIATLMGHRLHTDEVVLQTRTADGWAYYQAKNIRSQMYAADATLADLQGGTFSISNGGIFGSMLSTPILNPPQTGILGMHNIVERPVVRNGQIVIRPVMYLALSYDHRLIDGREAVQFLVRVKECIEDPERLLLEV